MTNITDILCFSNHMDMIYDIILEDISLHPFERTRNNGQQRTIVSLEVLSIGMIELVYA